MFTEISFEAINIHDKKIEMVALFFLLSVSLNDKWQIKLNRIDRWNEKKTKKINTKI